MKPETWIRSHALGQHRSELAGRALGLVETAKTVLAMVEESKASQTPLPPEVDAFTADMRRDLSRLQADVKQALLPSTLGGALVINAVGSGERAKELPQRPEHGEETARRVARAARRSGEVRYATDASGVLVAARPGMTPSEVAAQADEDHRRMHDNGTGTAEELPRAADMAARIVPVAARVAEMARGKEAIDALIGTPARDRLALYAELEKEAARAAVPLVELAMTTLRHPREIAGFALEHRSRSQEVWPEGTMNRFIPPLDGSYAREKSVVLGTETYWTRAVRAPLSTLRSECQ